MFVKWSCGCKGFIVEDKCWVISNCDRDITDDPLGVYERNMDGKAHEPLLYNSEVCLLLAEMGRLMSDGYALRQLRSLLNPR